MSARCCTHAGLGQRVVVVAVALWCGAGLALARETWRKVSTPEVTVVTTLGAKEATAWASEFVQYIAALRNFLGDRRAPLPTLTIVVFAQERDFQRYLPLSGPGGSPLPVGGFFVRHESWAVVGMPARVSEETRRTIFHEGVHWFLSTSDTRNPVWLEEGLAEVFSTFHADREMAEWGRAIEGHGRLLRSAPLLPLKQLLRTAQRELFGNDRMRTSLVYAEAWAFVHYLMFGQHDIPPRAMAGYLEALSSGMPPDEAFRKVFGRTYAEMDQQLRTYLADGQYHLARLPLAGAVKSGVQQATTVEVENALGRLAITGRRTAQAMAHAGAAMAAAPDDPRGHELFALALKASGDAAAALAKFEEAIARGSKEFQPYFEVAQAAHRATLDRQRPLLPAEARAIADQYERALGFYPRHLASYENLAGVIGLAEPMREDDRKSLELGHRLFPESAVIELGLAQLDHRSGNAVAARATVERVLASRQGMPGDGVEFARRLKVAWEQEEVMLLSQQVKTALDERQWVAARRALGRLLESSAPLAIKSEARRTLAALDERRLGLEPGQP